MNSIRRYLFFATALVFFLTINVYNKAYCLEGKISQEERAAIEKAGFFGIGSRTHENGIIIDYLTPDGPAAKAGFKIGDIITDIDNQEIDNKDAFIDFTNTTRAGQKLTITFFRNSETHKLVITLVPVSPATIRYKLWAKLGESWRNKASEAFQRKDFDNAIKYYETWLNADPHDEKSWYNLACAYALNGNKESALEAWEYAIDAGWDDSEKPPKEQDLELIWSEERFKRGLERCAKNKHLDDPKDYERNYIEMQSLGTYIAMLPPDYEESKKEYPLCVILHGRGSSEIDHGKLADELGREGIIYIAPRYSYPFVDVFIEYNQEGWSGYPPFDFGEDQSFHPIVENLSVDWIFTCVEDAKKHYRIAGDRIFTLGHSQGAFFSLACVALHPELVKSSFAFAPYVPDFYISEKILNGIKKHKVKVYLVHGTEDKVLEPEHSERAAKAMKEAGIDYVFKTFKVGHSFAPEIYSFAEEWLNTEVRAVKE